VRSAYRQPMNTVAWQRAVWVNRLQSLLLLLVMGSFLALLGGLLWGADGIVVLLLLGGVLLLLNPVVAPPLIMRMYQAQRLTPQQTPALFAILQELARRADLPQVPALYYIPSHIINAFAVGQRDEAAIALTDGLIRKLGMRETIGVLAHEVSHIRNRDTWVMGMADLFSRLTSMLSLAGQFLLILNLPLLLMVDASIHWGAVLLLICAPILSTLAQLGLSRAREFNADISAARLTGDPQGLARALVNIEQRQGSLWEQLLLPGRRNPEPSVLRTHPPTEERVRRLLQLELPASLRPILLAPRHEPWRFGDPVLRRPRWHMTGLWH
jgi:heat shock protein HtpX